MSELVLPIVQNYDEICVSRISTTNRTTLKTLISELITSPDFSGYSFEVHTYIATQQNDLT